MNVHTPANQADFEAYITQHTSLIAGADEADLIRYLRANPGHSRREWKRGSTPHLAEQAIDPLAPKDGLPRVAYVREQATTYLAHTLPLNIRREAARDPALVWNPLARRYRARTAEDGAATRGNPRRSDRTASPFSNAPASPPAGLASVLPAPSTSPAYPPVRKVFPSPARRPAVTPNVKSNPHFCAEIEDCEDDQ